MAREMPDKRGWRPARGTPCAEDGCDNAAVVLLYDGPDDKVGTALCAECASGGE